MGGPRTQCVRGGSSANCPLRILAKNHDFPASPTSRRPNKPPPPQQTAALCQRPSASLAAPRNRAEREALPERYYPCAFCDKAQGSGDGCRLWHLNVVALTWSRDP